MDPLANRRTDWELRLHLILVVDGQVVDDIFAALVHSLDPLANQRRHLVREGWIVGGDVWHGVCDQLRVTIVMLQPFAGERGAPSRCADQEATDARIAALPDLIANSLESEHGVEDVERDRPHSVRCIGGSRSLEGGH